MSNDTVRLGVRRILRIEDSKELKVIDKSLATVQTVDCRTPRVAIPLHFDSPAAVVDSEIFTDRYHLTLYGDELVYLHESVPLTG